MISGRSSFASASTVNFPVGASHGITPSSAAFTSFFSSPIHMAVSLLPPAPSQDGKQEDSSTRATDSGRERLRRTDTLGEPWRRNCTAPRPTTCLRSIVRRGDGGAELLGHQRNGAALDRRLARLSPHRVQ